MPETGDLDRRIVTAAVVDDLVGASFDNLTAAGPGVALPREQVEADLAHRAGGIGPKELRSEATRQLFLMDQDGPETLYQRAATNFNDHHPGGPEPNAA